MNKVIRTICLFRKNITDQDYKTLDEISFALEKSGFLVQTKRICLSEYNSTIDDNALLDKKILLGMGSFAPGELNEILENFIISNNKNINLDLSKENITSEHIDILFKIIKEKPSNTFNFTYSFNTPDSSPYFPSAKYGQAGFSVGLQPTDLAEDCSSLEEWLEKVKLVWEEINSILEKFDGYLGIDSSIAPIFAGKSSFVDFIKKIKGDFNDSVITDVYTKTTKFIKEKNPKLIGLCGLMFPCLEDFELADEYEKGNFSIERNIFLSLHSGLGIDTYPIAVNQNKEKIIGILRLVQQLSNKYNKPLSVRFVSDGKAKIGEKTDFKNPYLKDIIVREI